MKRLKVILTNDDGIQAEGIKRLAKALSKYAEVRVIAPDRQRSAVSHSIQFGRLELLPVTGYDVPAYSCNGTPADCVRLGFSVFPDTDLVFSGVNNGYNVAYDIIYSGTVSGAREALVNKHPGVAISVDQNMEILDENLDPLLRYVLENELYSDKYVLNINFPVHTFKKIKGYKKCPMGVKAYNTVYAKVAENTYDVVRETIEDYGDGCDNNYVNQGYVTFTPVGIDQTDYDALENLEVKEDVAI